MNTLRSRSRDPSNRQPPVASPGQHSLGRSIALHLLPGLAMTLFILLAAPVVEGWGFPGIFALFLGIGLVIAPIELGYLLYEARRTTGTWSLDAVVGYRQKLAVRQYLRLGIPLIVWWILMLVIFVPVIDPWIADRFFGWIPDSIREFSTFEDDETISTAALAVLLVVAFAFNGVVGPVVEELYFRGHLLPRVDRFGRWAPVLNAVLFSIYHFWTPWQNIGRIVAMLPWVFVVWRTRSIYLSLVVHMAVNNIFLLLILAVFL
jgi:uncharacterized protein